MNYGPNDHTFAVCAYGESIYLEECLASLKRQKVSSRIILCTSTPSDFLKRTAEKNELPLFIREGQCGIAADWNYALEQAETPLVTLAHQDDIYDPAFLAKTLEALNRQKRPLIAFTLYDEIRDGKRVPSSANRKLRIKEKMLFPLRSAKLQQDRRCRRAILSFGSAICCPSVTYVKTHLPAPLFTEGFLADLDWEAWERISKLPGSFCYVPQPLMGHRIHAASTTTRVIHGEGSRSREDLRMLEKFWPEKIAKLLNRFYSAAQKDNEL